MFDLYNNTMDTFTVGLYGTIAGLTRYTAKGVPGEALESVQFFEGLGMEGDFHANGGDRQISLLSLEERRWMNIQTERGLCFERYRENILIEGIPPAGFTPGVKLKIGEAILEISSVNKRCFRECSLFSRGQSCILAGQHRFAKVIRSGFVQIGDRVEGKGSMVYK